MEKELGGDAGRAGLYMLGMKLKPYEAICKALKTATAGLGTDELMLTSLCIRSQPILQEVRSPKFWNAKGEKKPRTRHTWISTQPIASSHLDRHELEVREVCIGGEIRDAFMDENSCRCNRATRAHRRGLQSFCTAVYVDLDRYLV